MKNFWISLWLAAGLLYAGSALAVETPPPEPETVEAGDDGLTFPETVSNLITIGKYFHEKYPGSAIEEDFSDPDLMPSVTTMQITRSPYYQQPAKAQQKEVTKQRYTARSKILIASYAAVVLALALIITLTTISVASLFSQVSALEATLNTEKAVVATLDEDIEAAGSADAVIEKAQEMGMTAGVISGSVALPETKAPVEANVSTNWFDSLCDTLSKLFG